MKKENLDIQTILPSAKVVYPVEQLMRGSAEVILVHAGEEYRLRITRNKKLILTK